MSLPRWHAPSENNRTSKPNSDSVMSTKPSRWLYGLAAALLGVFGVVSPLHAQNPPWPPLVSVIALDPDASEQGSDSATFLVVRLGLANTPLTVHYVLGGTAVNGVDYEPLSGSVTIPSGEHFAPVVITPIDDYLIEGTETVVLALQQPPVSPPPYIVTWPSVAVAEIADNDLAPTNTPPFVSLVRPPDGAVFEAYDDIVIVARAGDSDGRVVTVEFFAGDQSLGIVTNQPSPGAADLLDRNGGPLFGLAPDLFPDLDASLEVLTARGPGKLFRLRWADAPPGHHVLTAVATDNDGESTRSAPVEIKVLPPPPRPVVTIRATDPVATEPDPTTDHLDTATFTLYRRGPTNATLQVFYRIGGTAESGVDYAEIPHSVEIPAGERRARVVIEPLDDLLVEGTETVILSLVEPPCITLFPPPPDCYEVGRSHTARAIIRDTDVPPNQPPLVRLVKPEDGGIFVAPAHIRLAALARDLDGFVTKVEFFEGENSLGIVTNHPALDPVVRPPFSLVWSNVPPGSYVLTAVATDNGGESTRSQPVEIKVVPRQEPPVVNITAIDPEAAEPGVLTVINPAIFKVTRTGSTTWPLVVFYRIAGSAENGVDYRLISNRVEIPAGESSANIVIEPLHDELVEGTETVVLKLTPPPVSPPTPSLASWWYRIGPNDVARAWILDNDLSPGNQPPRVRLVHPEEGQVFRAPQAIRLVAAAHDPDGWVRTVEFFSGNLSLGVVTNQPFSGGDPGAISPEQWFRLLWQNAPPGVHLLTAKATDNRGVSTVSEPVRIKVLPLACPPVVTIFATDPFASEGDWFDQPPGRPGPLGGDPINLDPPIFCPPKTATFTVVRDGCLDYDLLVHYRLEGIAENGVDYDKLPGQVTIPRGAHRAQIVVAPIDDDLPEPTETVVAVLEPPICIAIYPPPPDCYRVGDPHRAVAYIFDNDRNQSPKLEIVHPRPGDLFQTGSDIGIDVVTRDPDGWVWRMEFFANGEKIGEEQIQFIVPPPPGQPQKFSLIWSNVPAGEYALTARATDDQGAMAWSDPVRIKVGNIPPLPVVTIEAVDPCATEPNPVTPAFDSAKFQVSRKGDLSRPLTVQYRIGGTASNGVDYQRLSGVVTIPSESASAIIEVIPLPDALEEGTESVILALQQPPCVIGGADTPDCYLVGRPGRAIAYIRDAGRPNRPPTVAIVSPANGSVFTAPTDLRLVAAAGDPDGWVTTVEFFAGDTSLGVVRNPMVILEDTPFRLPELDCDVLTENSWTRPFVLLWRNVPPGNHVLTAVATDNAGDQTRSRPVEITVREAHQLPVVRIMATDAVAREGTDNTATFRIHRTGPTNSALTVFYAIGGTAENGVDYVAIPGSLTIPAGRRSARIVITPIDDNLPERVETVLLRLTEPPYGSPLPFYEIGRPARAGAIILDNDCPLRAPEPLADGSLHLRLTAFKGLPFRLEASTNLLDWEEVASAINTEDGISVVEERREYPQRFFRVVPEFGELEAED